MVPTGMTSHVHAFDAREGGSFRISLTYDAPTGTGKTTAHTDTFHGRFVKLVPNEQVCRSGRIRDDGSRAARRNPGNWQLRIGIHIGPVVAGVIGHTKFNFDLWGDTVNVAARLSQFGSEGSGIAAPAIASARSRSKARASSRSISVGHPIVRQRCSLPDPGTCGPGELMDVGAGCGGHRCKGSRRTSQTGPAKSQPSRPISRAGLVGRPRAARKSIIPGEQRFKLCEPGISSS